MKLILVDPIEELCDAFESAFSAFDSVEVHNGYFEEVPEYDCMVSAANSFGIMDGGVDAAITKYFGRQLMARVQARIIDEWSGEQPVGTSMIVETTHPDHPYLAHTPTMRYPMSIFRTDAVYNAMWAMLNAVKNFNKTAETPIDIIACPGLGTATGAVPYAEAARQMALAYQNFRNPPQRISWLYAEARQRAIRFGGYYGYSVPMEGEK